MSDANTPAIKNNDVASRFETTVDGQTGYVEYRRTADTIELVHTIVPPPIEGRGIGTALAEYALAFARTNSLKVIPTCGFIKAHIASHPDQADVVG